LVRQDFFFDVFQQDRWGDQVTDFFHATSQLGKTGANVIDR